MTNLTDRIALRPREAAEALYEPVAQRMSASLVAPAGTGKTLTLRLLRSLLPEARYRVRYVKITGLSKRDLCKEIAVACGLASLAGYAIFDGFSPFVVAATTAVAAGAMLTMIVDTMIPEAFAETHNWAGLIAVLGFLTSFALSKLAG